MSRLHPKFMFGRVWQALRWRLGQRVAAPELEFGDELSLAAFYDGRVTDCAFCLTPLIMSTRVRNGYWIECVEESF
jgi:hypothetical protein